MRLQIKREEYIPLLILFQNNLVLYLSIFLYSIRITSWLRYSLFPILFVVSIVLNYKKFSFKVPINSFVYLALVAITIISHYIIFPDNQEILLDNMGNLMWCAFGGYIFGLTVYDLIVYENEHDWNVLYLLSLATLAICVVYSYYTLASGRVERYVQGKSDMATAFKVLPAFMIICWKGIKSPKVGTMIPLIVSVIYIFSLGTRGAMIWLLVFIMVSLIVYSHHQAKATKWIFISLLISIIALFYENILQWLSNIISRLGFSVKIFDTINSGSFLISDSRDRIAYRAIELIKQNPLFGYGIFSDRKLIGEYCHNIALEVYMDFGVIIGSVILIWILYKIFIAFIKAPTLEHKVFELVLFFSSIGVLLMSGTYLLSPLFFVLLAYCDCIIIKNKIGKN